MNQEREQERILLERALGKMRREQARDPNCIWAEIEDYLLYMEDVMKEREGWSAGSA